MGGLTILPDSEQKPTADDAGIATHTVEEVQNLMDRLSVACKEFGLIISLHKTNDPKAHLRSIQTKLTIMSKV